MSNWAKKPAKKPSAASDFATHDGASAMGVRRGAPEAWGPAAGRDRAAGSRRCPTPAAGLHAGHRCAAMLQRCPQSRQGRQLPSQPLRRMRWPPDSAPTASQACKLRDGTSLHWQAQKGDNKLAVTSPFTQAVSSRDIRVHSHEQSKEGFLEPGAPGGKSNAR